MEACIVLFKSTITQQHICSYIIPISFNTKKKFQDMGSEVDGEWWGVMRLGEGESFMQNLAQYLPLKAKILTFSLKPDNEANPTNKRVFRDNCFCYAEKVFLWEKRFCSGIFWAKCYVLKTIFKECLRWCHLLCAFCLIRRISVIL